MYINQIDILFDKVLDELYKYLLKNTRMIKSTNTFFSKYINIYIKQLLE